MTSPVAASAKVEDMVKRAIREALEKRKIAGVAPVGEEVPDMEEEVTTPPKEYEGLAECVLGDDQVKFSTLLNLKTLTAGNDFAVTIYKTELWDESIRDFIPKIDPDYLIPVETASSILLAWELDEKVLCYGPTGAGKSTLVEQLCALTKRPFIRINCTGDMDSSMIFGQLTAKDGSTVWVDGPVTEAVRHGAVFAWDEWDVTPPEIAMGLQWLLEDNGKLFLKEMPGTSQDKLVIPHKHFKLVAIGNTQGQGDDTGAHAGTNVQNSATLDRFGTAIYVDYLSHDAEENILKKKFSENPIVTEYIQPLVKVANLVRSAYRAGQLSLTMSPRTLISVCRKVAVGRSLHEALANVYLNKLSGVQAKVAKELVVKIMGSKFK